MYLASFMSILGQGFHAAFPQKGGFKGFLREMRVDMMNSSRDLHPPTHPTTNSNIDITSVYRGSEK